MMDSIQHPASTLWDRHHPASYPVGVVGVRRPIPGPSFFPGGYGLWDAKIDAPLPVFPVSGVMVLGHDFHSETGYEASLERRRESENQPTWRNLLKLLRAADVPLERCFFTNFYMGLRKGKVTTGVFPGATDKDFRRHCSEFLIEQLKAMRPSVIVTLGKYVPALIAPLSSDLNGWLDSKTFRHIDEAGPVQWHCAFEGVPDFETTIVALVHPSMRHASIGRRTYKNHKGHHAEMAMLRDALAMIGPGSQLTPRTGMS